MAVETFVEAHPLVESPTFAREREGVLRVEPRRDRLFEELTRLVRASKEPRGRG